MLKAILQGKPLGHPLHTLLVHFPMAFFSFSLVLDLAAWASSGSADLVRASFYALALGVGTAILAAIPGLADWSGIRIDDPARRRATVHMVLNLLVVSLYAVNLAWRYQTGDRPVPPTGPLVLSLLGFGLLSLSSYIGGLLVYQDGVGVGRHRRRAETPAATVRVATPADADGWVPVADAAGLHDRQMVRAEVDGVALVIANLGGRFFSFQEYCTHRCGPLSEGSCTDGQVICPWHHSSFDVETGKVVEGPAKVDLRVFTTAVRAGKICVRPPRESQG